MAFNWVDLIRVLSIVLVIVAHSRQEEHTDWLADMVYAATRVGVPLFFMISGFLNLDAVGGAGWPGVARLTIRVFTAQGGELLFAGEASTDLVGRFYQDIELDLLPLQGLWL